jgi:hypothetical protein
MDYLYEPIRPTRLYIKQCSHCDLKYFGKTISENVETYPGSGLKWSVHLAKHDAVSIHLWNSDWYYDTSITRFALKFSKINKIVESKIWANLKDENGLDGGGPGELGKIKLSETRRSIEWKESVGYEAAKKCSETKRSNEWKTKTGNAAARKSSITQNDPAWKETKGKEKVIKDLEKKHDLEWKSTVGKLSKQKELATKSDPIWLETVGKEAAKKCSETKKSLEWKESIGKEAFRKLSETQNSEEWKKANFRECEICGKKEISPGNYSRWHGKNCRER